MNTCQDTLSNIQTWAFYTSEGRPWISEAGQCSPLNLRTHRKPDTIQRVLRIARPENIPFHLPSKVASLRQPSSQAPSVWERCQKGGVGEQALKGI